MIKILETALFPILLKNHSQDRNGMACTYFCHLIRTCVRLSHLVGIWHDELLSVLLINSLYRRVSCKCGAFVSDWQRYSFTADAPAPLSLAANCPSHCAGERCVNKQCPLHLRIVFSLRDTWCCYETINNVLFCFVPGKAYLWVGKVQKL